MLALSSLYFGTSIVTITVAAVLIAGLNALFHPALLITVPALVDNNRLLYGANSLFDVTTRLSRLVGPSLAAALSGFLSPLYVFVAAAAGFFASVIAIAQVRKPIAFAGRAEAQDDFTEFPRRLKRFVEALRKHLDVALVLLSNMIVYGLWNIGFVLGVALLFRQHGEIAEGGYGLKNYAVILAAFAVGEIVSSVIIANWNLSKPWVGYMLLGGAMALIPYPMQWFPAEAQLSAMTVCAFFSGIGAPMFFLPMILMLQNRFIGDELLEVTRLRQALLVFGLLIASAAAPLLFETLEAALAITLVGSTVLMIGLLGQCTKTMAVAAP